MRINLSEHFTYKKLFRFTLPSIAMMIFTSIYGVVDGFFVSNFAGDTAFTAVNFIYPVIMILGSFGFMFGAGGSALIGKTLGEKDPKRANRLFSLFVYISVLCGVALSVIGVFTVRPLAILMGAEGEMLELCVLYARIILIALPAFMLQFEFQSFFITAEKSCRVATQIVPKHKLIFDGIGKDHPAHPRLLRVMVITAAGNDQVMFLGDADRLFKMVGKVDVLVHCLDTMHIPNVRQAMPLLIPEGVRLDHQNVLLVAIFKKLLLGVGI